jgi:hypothetical protein
MPKRKDHLMEKEESAMKSALELAMERTSKLVSEETAGLSEDQKKRIAEIEAEFRAKVAEAEIMLEQKIRGAQTGDPESTQALVDVLREEFGRDKESWEGKKTQEIEKVKGKAS